MNNMIKLGADIGGSHIATALVDMDDACIIPHTSRRTAVNSKASAKEIIDCWVSTLTTTIQLSSKKVECVGIAMPGPFDYRTGVSLMKGNDKYESLYGLNIKDILSDALKIPVQHIRISNDAGCFLKGEVLTIDGSYNRAIGITLGTGLGTCRYVNGISEDADLWSMPFKDGIAEDYISTRWFIKRYFELSGDYVKNVKEIVLQSDFRWEVRQLFDEFAENLFLFLYNFIKMDDPEVVIIGGNIARADHLFFTKLQSNFSNQNLNISLKRAVMGEDAFILGAVL